MLIQMIEHKAGIVFEKVGAPLPDDIIRATFRSTLKQLAEVEDKVIPIFTEAADQLIESEGGDVKRALTKTLALLSGHHKECLTDRSLLNAQPDMVTFQMVLTRPFY